MTNLLIQETIQDIDKCFSFPIELLKAFSFVPFGLCSTLCNGLLIIAILNKKQLRCRKEIRIICALSVADFVEAFATLLGGLYRILIILLDLKDVKTQPLQCMLLPHSWLWRWSDFATSFMLLTVTFDRLLSVIIPIKYIKWGPTYSYITIGTPYTLSLLLSMLAWQRPLSRHNELSLLCMNVYITPWFYTLSKYLAASASMLSIIFYIPVVIVIKTQKKRISQIVCNAQAAYQHKVQLRMTMALAFSCFATFFLDAIPRAIGIYGSMHPQEEIEIQCESAMQMLFHLTKLNSIINLLLYYHRNADIRKSILSILCFYRDKKRKATVSCL